MLSRDFQQRPIGAEAKSAFEKRNVSRENWLEFCMFPDLIEAVRMPSLFPVPTHIVKRQSVFTVTPATSEIYGIWKPHTITNGNYTGLQEGYRSAFNYVTSVGAMAPNNTDATINNTVVYNVQSTPSLLGATGLVHGGARMIGAFIEIEYIGTSEQHAGLIEVGLHMHSANTAWDLTAPHLMTQGEIIQAPFYRKFKPNSGVRCIWFPVDDEAFNFQDFDVGQADAGIDPAAGGDDPVNRKVWLKQLILRQPVHPEWCINLTGLTVGQNIRVHMCSYYETVPDEAFKDIYGSRRSSATASATNLRGAITQAVQTEMVATTAKSADGFADFKDKASQFIEGLSSAYGIYQTAAPIFGAAMKLF